MRHRHFWSIFFIVLSYIFTYFAPIILLYFSLRHSFVVEYITFNRISLSFLGFMTISILLLIVFLFKLTIKLRKTKASIFKSVVFGVIHVAIVLLFVYFLHKLKNFTYIIEEDTVAFITHFRNFLTQFRNYLIIFSICLGLSTISNIVAISIDREFVRSIDWL